MKEKLEKISKNIRDGVESSFSKENLAILEKIIAHITDCLKKGGKILLCGNGGSATQAQHVAAEFVGRFKKERKALPAIALTADIAILTALANDYSFDVVFSRQVEALGKKGDVLIGLSTSGSSKNVVAAFEKAKAMGLFTVSLTGGKGSLRDISDLNFSAKADSTPHIQEVHLAALHAICEVAEENLSD